jgi:hypothetical protein
LARAKWVDSPRCVGKHTDELAIELVAISEGKTDCNEWHTDGWGGYSLVLPDDIVHYTADFKYV